MKTLLISACLLGLCCRYDGGSKPQPGVEALAEQYRLVPVCPEQLGGLPTPRCPAERLGGKIVTEDGRDVTEQFLRGTAERLQRLEYGLRRRIAPAVVPCGVLRKGIAVTRLKPDACR